MANLKDLIVNGASRFIGKLHTNDAKVGNILEANKVVLTEGVSYGTSAQKPTTGNVKGQIYFQKV